MRTRNKDKAIKIGLIIVLIALAVGVAGNYIRSHNIKIITIPAETAYVTYEGYGFVCVNEYLMSANMSGKVAPVINEGERIGKNYAVYALQGVDTDGNNQGTPQYFYAPVAGLVSYKIDGYENTDDLNQITALNLEELYTSLHTDETDEQEIVQSGAACAKIIDNVGTLRLICTLAHNDYTDSLAEVSSVRLTFPELDFEAVGRINGISTNGEEAVLDLNISGAYDSLYLSRAVKVQFGEYVTQNAALPTSAIIYRDGEAGVYALSKKFVYWRAVELKDVDSEGNVIVEGLSEGDEVVADAQNVKEGMYVY